MKKLLALIFIVSLISCDSKNSDFQKTKYKSIERNGYKVYCFENFGKIRDMDTVFYTIDSVVINNPPKDFKNDDDDRWLEAMRRYNLR